MNRNNIENTKEIILDLIYDAADWIADILESDNWIFNRFRTNKTILFWVAAIGLIAFISIRATGGGGLPAALTAQEASQQAGQTFKPPSVKLALDPDNVTWPNGVEAAIGIVGQGVVVSTANGSKALPMASLAKLMTALVLIDAIPLQVGEQGPEIPLTAADVDIYNSYVAINGSVLPVDGLDSMSLHDVLQALLIRSANNLADTAVIWAFGSVDEYTALANQKAKELGFESMHIADATGFSPKTAASAEDLIRLGELTMQNPVLASIVGTWSTELKGIGPIFNTNNFLDFEGNGVIGVKTGDTNEAGGTYISAAKRKVLGEDIIILISILKGPDHFTAQQVAIPLFDQAVSGFQASQR